MPTFSSKPLGRKPSATGSALSKLTPQVRKHPVIFFGIPFTLIIVAGSYGLSYLTQTRYDYNATKAQSMSKQEELGMRKDRRKVDIREEYFRLQSKDSESQDWEPKRIERPAGTPEWGVPPIHNEELPSGRMDPVPGFKGKSGKANVILGPDGKPCRACNSKLAFSAAMKGSKGHGDDVGTQNAKKSETEVLPSSGTFGLEETTDRSQQHSSCPPDGEVIGNSTWTFLHSIAAYYPAEPSTKQQSSILSLIQSLPHLYPCHSCAEALQEELKREEVDKRSWEGGRVLSEAVKSGQGMRRWLCGLHNEVNQRLGKPMWNCDEKLLQTKWLTGPDDGSCD
ncbi:hypothetical protein CBS101457_006519 [Exobasidium rhododendri]|nr:hypothetical protein CBS101457_006519 [Exobasidium rhododendri]